MIMRKPGKRVRQPLHGPELTDTAYDSVVNWKDLVFFSPAVGSIITHSNKPIVHARLCQWHRATYDERQSLKEPRAHRLHFYVTTLQMIGGRKVDYSSLKNAARRLCKTTKVVEK